MLLSIAVLPHSPVIHLLITRATHFFKQQNLIQKHLYAMCYVLLTNPSSPGTSFFKTLIDHTITVELKNDIKITGTLKSVDQYLNIKLDDISVAEELRYPHLSAVKNVFIRGSVVRYVHLPSAAVDVTLLEDAARRGTFSSTSLLSPFVSLYISLSSWIEQRGHGL